MITYYGPSCISHMIFALEILHNGKVDIEGHNRWRITDRRELVVTEVTGHMDKMDNTWTICL